MKVSVAIPAYNEGKLLWAYLAVGGLSPALYAGEELALTRALRHWGLARGLGFAIITKAPHFSSGCKFRLNPFRAVKDPGRLGVFYEGRR